MRLSEFVLRYRLGEGEWQVFPLTSHEIMLGRDDDNDLKLDHREVSRHHLRIRFDEGRFLISDLESSNGTSLDGMRLTPQIPIELRPGQMISVGDFTLVLEKASESGTHISKELLPFLLRYRFGAGTWQAFPIEPGKKILGRDPNCDFYLNDTEVSRHHARLQIAESEIWLTDLGSTNGTIVAGVALKPEQPYRLKLGQQFSIGNYILQVDEPSRFYKLSSDDEEKTSGGTSSAPDLRTSLSVEKSPVALIHLQAINLMSHKRTTLGRAPDNEIELKHPLVSRYHAVIERQDTDFRIRDLNSTYGVFLNDQHLKTEAILKDWDQIRIGAFLFVFSGHDLQQQVHPGMGLEILNLSHRVQHSQSSFDDISLTIKPEELVAIIGMNGSGKTKLLKALSGYEPASHGQILVNDLDLYQHYDLFRNEIGYVPQKNFLHASLTPDEALEYAARLRLPPDTTKDERVALSLEILKDLDLVSCRNVPISQLSDEQIQRVLIASELLAKPRLLYLDEPSCRLSPEAEYGMSKLLRRLADQGRTVFWVAPATHNLMHCDKVIVLTKGGSLAYFGPPEDALVYFNSYRTEREFHEKEMEFSDICRILSDVERGQPQEWRERYLKSHTYYRVFGIDPSLAELQSTDIHTPAPESSQVQRSSERIAGFRQFRVLTSRSLKIFRRDKIWLALALVLPLLLGLLDFVWGRNLYDSVYGDAQKVILMWFMSALTAFGIGAFSSMFAIVTEEGGYQHERMANLKIISYISSKLWVGVALALFQAGVLLVFKLYFVNPKMPAASAYLAMYFTLFLGTLAGYLLGLLISSISSQRSIAVIFVGGALLVQILFSGALLPLDWVPGGRQISALMPTRWTYEALVRITGFGGQFVRDSCWQEFGMVESFRLPPELVESCPCMGASIFVDCADFPGILSPERYGEAGMTALNIQAPLEPPRPTALPTPTFIPSPTWYPTPTLLPTLTPFPTPQNAGRMSQYRSLMDQQVEEYRNLVNEQFVQYRMDNLAQAKAYYDARDSQIEGLISAQQAQSDDYFDALGSYNVAYLQWQENRENVIRSAERLVGSIIYNYQQVFEGTVLGRWSMLILLQVIFVALVLTVQKRKDKN